MVVRELEEEEESREEVGRRRSDRGGLENETRRSELASGKKG